MHYEILSHILPYLPFVGAAVVGNNTFNFGTLISRILETAIIGAEHKNTSSKIHNHDIELTALKAEIQALRREASMYHKGMQ